MLIAHKIELRPTNEQKIYLNKACGCKRHCDNHLLAHFSQPDVKWSKYETNQFYINVLRSDVGFRMLRQLIEYKAKLRNCIVVVADRFFPSS
jgi:transposase